jgi:hypothetical protein
MSRQKPNIVVGTALKKRDRLGFKQFTLKVVTDTFLVEWYPDAVEFSDSPTNTLFVLTLFYKKFYVGDLQVDTFKDYIDIYLYGVKEPQDRYTVGIENGTDIVIRFTENITRLPQNVRNDFLAGKNPFLIKGKIRDRDAVPLFLVNENGEYLVDDEENYLVIPQ